jgi:glutamyl-tRNA synthetase
MKNHPRVRIAPSPSGNLHIGTARSALFNFLFAKKEKGTFIVRIEDTDKERSKEEYEENILEGLSWLGLSWNEFYKQSESGEIYRKHLKKMIDAGSVYLSKEDIKKPGQRSEVIRFKNPNRKITFTDIIRGDVTFDSTELGDFIVARSEDEPLYHLAAVIDDHEMEVSHVIRGEDHVSNTPRQILIQEAIGANRPIYAHIPLILAPDRTKLSKRHGAISVVEFRESGYLPQALINYMALLGWNPGTDQEVLSIDELVEQFDLTRVQKGGAIFDEEKLKWINTEHKKLLTDKELEVELEKIKNRVRVMWENPSEVTLERLTGVLKVSGSIYTTLAEQEVFIEETGLKDYILNEPDYEPEQLKWKKQKDLEGTKRHLTQVRDALNLLDENKFTAENIKKTIWQYAEKEGRGDVLWPMRFALSGKEKSPDPFSLAGIFGKELTISRINHALIKLQKNVSS